MAESNLQQNTADQAVAMPTDIESLARLTGPPALPSKGPFDWVRVNLFSSIGNTVLTLAVGYITISIMRWMLGLIFDETADWSSVTTNIRLLNTYNYPEDQYIRVWVTVGFLLATAALTLAAFEFRPGLLAAQVGRFIMAVGAAIALIGLLAPLTQTTTFKFLIVGLAVGALGFAFIKLVPNSSIRVISIEWLMMAGAAVLLGTLWLVPFGRNEFVDGQAISTPGTINPSTQWAWTAEIFIFLVAYIAGRLVINSSKLAQTWLRSTLTLWWVAGPAFLIFLVWRDPEFDWNHVLTTDIPIGLGFTVFGAILLYFLTNPTKMQKAQVVGAALLVLAALTWAAAFFGFNWLDQLFELVGIGHDSGLAQRTAAILGLWPMLQKVRLSILALGLFAIAAPTFASAEPKERLKYAGYWATLMILGHWLITAVNTNSTVELTAPPFLGGFAASLGLSYYVVLLSLPIGLLMALGRTSKFPIFRILSTVYIETVRGVPLITVLFFFAIVFPQFLPEGMTLKSKLSGFLLGYSLFAGAYMAENIRGGLLAVRQGQHEAADALGLTPVQRSGLIVVPQALRISIPNIVGQAISTFKETSLIAIASGVDLLRVANDLVSGQTAFQGQRFPALIYASFLYFIVSFTMSKYSQGLERKLGVGTR